MNTSITAARSILRTVVGGALTLMLLGMSGLAGATPAAVQAAYQDPTSASTVSVTYAQAQNVGDLNVVIIAWKDSTSSVTSVTDSQGNSYAVAVGPTVSPGNATQLIYYAYDIAAASAGSNVVTVVFSNSVNAPDVRIAEYSGIAYLKSPLDVAVGASGTGTALNSGSVTTKNAVDLVIGASYGGGKFSAVGSTFTNQQVSADGSLLEYKVIPATGSKNATSNQTPSSWWVMQMVTFAQGTYVAYNLTTAPYLAALTLGQTEQFRSNAPTGASVAWSVDGIAGGNSAVGTISSTGLYAPPSTAGTHTVTASYSGVTATSTVAITDLTGVTTWHNDLARTGQNLHEYALTPTTIESGNFGKIFSCPVDATVYAQPLYVANLSIGGGTHNVVFVATENDSLYAFDADSPNCVTYWQTSFINPAAGITATPASTTSCNDIVNTFGITGTPVIDPVAQILYVVAATSQNGVATQTLHAVSLSSGQDVPNSPVVIQGSVTGATRTVTFSAVAHLQRAALVLTGGQVIVAFGAHCDDLAWHGWLMAYNATTLQQTAVFNSTPNGSEGGIWMSGAGPAVDAENRMFLSTGNGTFDDTSNTLPAVIPNNDFGESFLNINPSTLTVQDYYTPSQNTLWTSQDGDISASGMTVLPDGVGPSGYPNLLVGDDKFGHLWLIDRDAMSGYAPNGDDTVQYLTLPLVTKCMAEDKHCVHSNPAYYNGTIYIGESWYHVMAYPLTNGLIQANAQAVAVPSAMTTEEFNYPGPTPVISASPSGNGILWVLDNFTNGTDNGSHPLGPAVLHAYNAANIGTELYNSSVKAADTGGNAAKFTIPVVANGHVYVAGAGSLTVYGFAP